MRDLTLSVGLARKLEIAFKRNGWALSEVDKLCEGNALADVRRVLLGDASITVVEHVIDCDAQPFVPDGWSVEEHQKGGAYKWDKDAQKNALYLSKGQAGGKCIGGNKLRRELASQPVLNANAFDYLLANPHLIPEEWKDKCVFFWGTVYRRRDGRLCVRCLYWLGGGWIWGSSWLDRGFDGGGPAAVRAS